MNFGSIQCCYLLSNGILTNNLLGLLLIPNSTTVVVRASISKWLFSHFSISIKVDQTVDCATLFVFDSQTIFFLPELMKNFCFDNSCFAFCQTDYSKIHHHVCQLIHSATFLCQFWEYFRQQLSYSFLNIRQRWLAID